MNRLISLWRMPGASGVALAIVAVSLMVLLPTISASADLRRKRCVE